MTNLSPRVCFTAGGLVVHQQQILLIKHRKLGLWLAPGGHVEAAELPHETALREVLEETGVTAEILSATPLPSSNSDEYLPTPLLCNRHFVSQDNYHSRLKQADPSQPVVTPTWPRGCEQHVVWLYYMHPVGELQLLPNQTETTDLGWFSASELRELSLTPTLLQEFMMALTWQPIS